MAEIPFVKYHGSGNDFVLIDERDADLSSLLGTEEVAAICRRHLGVGADGLMRLKKSENADFRMLYYNADGRESSLCGNGSRCIVAFAKSLGIVEDYARFETSDGEHEAWILYDGRIRLRMHIPHGYQQFNTQNHFIDTGSPHHVQFLEDRTVEAVAIREEGAALRHDARYAPGGTNANFVQAKASDRIAVRTFERGVEDETLSCGTGVTACAYVHLLQQEILDGTVTIETPGGLLEVEVQHRGSKNEKVFLTGPAQRVFSGIYLLS